MNQNEFINQIMTSEENPVKTEEPSLTHRFYPQSKRIAGYTDGKEAIKQTVYKILDTQRYAYPIYSKNYGINFYDLIGLNRDYAAIIIEHRIAEAFSFDGRITGIDNFNISYGEDLSESENYLKDGRDSLLISFHVKTRLGDIPIEKEVVI